MSADETPEADRAARMREQRRAATAMYPRGIFLPIETSGDGAVNVYSRIQMQLFKAKKAAEREVEEALAATGLKTLDEVRAYVETRGNGLAHAFHRSPHRAGCTAADLIHEVGDRRNPLRTAQRTLIGFWNAWRGNGGDAHTPKLADVARAAAAKVPAAPPQPPPTTDRAAEDKAKLPSGFRPLPLAR